MRLKASVRNKLVADVRREMHDYHAKHFKGTAIEKHCLLWAHFMAKALRDRGIKAAQIQAGTCSWPIISPEKDDGNMPTHYTYQFSMKEALPLIVQAKMPEMHVWVGIPEHPQELIDLTAPWFQKRAAEEHGFKVDCWTPPKFLWVQMSDDKGNSLDNLPPGVRYLADWDATSIAYGFLKSALSEGHVDATALSLAGDPIIVTTNKGAKK